MDGPGDLLVDVANCADGGGSSSDGPANSDSCFALDALFNQLIPGSLANEPVDRQPGNNAVTRMTSMQTLGARPKDSFKHRRTNIRKYLLAIDGNCHLPRPIAKAVAWIRQHCTDAGHLGLGY
jgi:hypothetical protein